jgi:adenine phosphoribosyltransferase
MAIAAELNAAELASAHAVAYLHGRLRTIPDFPKPGIRFKDITPLLGEPRALALAVDLCATPFVGRGVRHVVAIEARGFILGGAVAKALGAGFVPVRKPGKLPAESDEVCYALEYGTGTLAMHKGSIEPGAPTLIVDDLLATGGTAAAAAELVVRQGGSVVAYAFLVELTFLAGRSRLAAGTPAPVHAILPIGD